MTDELRSKIRKLRAEVSSAFAAVKVMIDGVRDRVARLEALEERIRELEIKLANQEGKAEVTGRIILQNGNGKDEAAVEVAERSLSAERTKSTSLIAVALITGVFGTITGLISLISKFIGADGP